MKLNCCPVDFLFLASHRRLVKLRKGALRHKMLATDFAWLSPISIGLNAKTFYIILLFVKIPSKSMKQLIHLCSRRFYSHFGFTTHHRSDAKPRSIILFESQIVFSRLQSWSSKVSAQFFQEFFINEITLQLHEMSIDEHYITNQMNIWNVFKSNADGGSYKCENTSVRSPLMSQCLA